METFISRWWGQEVIRYGDPLYESMRSESESWKGPEQVGVLSLISFISFLETSLLTVYVVTLLDISVLTSGKTRVCIPYDPASQISVCSHKKFPKGKRQIQGCSLAVPSALSKCNTLEIAQVSSNRRLNKQCQHV